jgi:hypothetical protein
MLLSARVFDACFIVARLHATTGKHGNSTADVIAIARNFDARKPTLKLFPHSGSQIKSANLVFSRVPST